MKRNRRVMAPYPHAGVHKVIGKSVWIFALFIVGVMAYGVFWFMAPVLGLLWAIMCASPILFILGICVIGWLLFIVGILVLALLN